MEMMDDCFDVIVELLGGALEWRVVRHDGAPSLPAIAVVLGVKQSLLCQKTTDDCIVQTKACPN
jgi:hypothetical protein